jgi:hypothetical protein
MIGRTNTCGGGSGGLNFTVVGGTTAPKNPKENMIWINTNTPITDWVFSATQPSAKSGRVWISTGTSSQVEYNALKKNGIQVYPLSAKQYVNGSWVDKVAKSNRGGTWIDWWNGELFDNGNQYEHLTGGWTGNGYTVQGSNKFWAGEISDGKIVLQGYQGYYTQLGTNEPIDVTGYSTVTANCDEVKNSLGMAIATSKVNAVNDCLAWINVNEGADTIVLPIPTGATKVYILVYALPYDVSKGIISKIKLNR